MTIFAVGIIVMALGLFSAIAWNVSTGGALTIVDDQIAHWFHSHATPPVTAVMLVFTHAHDTISVSIAAALLALYLAWMKRWFWLVTVSATIPFGMFINLGVSQVMQRARPSFDDPLLIMTTYGFPSGHVSGATLFYGVVVAMMTSTIHRWPMRMALWMATFTIVALVALTRLYLGVHYLSDVVAAFALSVAWLTVGLSGTRMWRCARGGAGQT